MRYKRGMAVVGSAALVVAGVVAALIYWPAPADRGTIWLAVDRPVTPETTPVIDGTVAKVVDEATSTNQFATLKVAAGGGGPGDITVTPFAAGCEGTSRKCAGSEPARRDQIFAGVRQAISTPPQVSGASPISTAWATLSAARPGDQVTIITTFLESSELLVLDDTVDLSTIRLVIDHIEAAGLAFHQLDLAEVEVTLVVVAAGTARIAPARYEQMLAFAAELTGITPTRVTV